MTELLSLLNPHDDNTPESVRLHFEPLHYLGLSLKSYIRFVYFEHSRKGAHHIGFKKSDIEEGKLYLIPPYEFYSLPYTAKDFHCIDIPLGKLTAHHKQLLLGSAYTGNNTIEADSCLLKRLYHTPEYVNAGMLFDALERQYPALQSSDRYLHEAVRLYEQLRDIAITHDYMVEDLAATLGVPRYTLLRVCKSVFDRTPEYILNYHLLGKCIFLLLHHKETPVADIAYSLSFKDTTTFCRFIKDITLKTPLELRKNYGYIR